MESSSPPELDREEQTMTTHVDDLKFAKATAMAADIEMFNRTKYLTGVHEVDEEVGTATIYAPTTFGDAATRRISLADIMSVSVTQIEYPPPTAG